MTEPAQRPHAILAELWSGTPVPNDVAELSLAQLDELAKGFSQVRLSRNFGAVQPRFEDVLLACRLPD